MTPVLSSQCHSCWPVSETFAASYVHVYCRALFPILPLHVYYSFVAFAPLTFLVSTHVPVHMNVPIAGYMVLWALPIGEYTRTCATISFAPHLMHLICNIHYSMRYCTHFNLLIHFHSLHMNIQLHECVSTRVIWKFSLYLVCIRLYLLYVHFLHVVPCGVFVPGFAILFGADAI